MIAYRASLCCRLFGEEAGQRATILADSQDAASLPNSSPYAARATMTDLCELQLERGALVLRGFDDLLRLADCCASQDATRRLERDGAHAHLTLLSKNDTRTAAAQSSARVHSHAVCAVHHRGPRLSTHRHHMHINASPPSAQAHTP